jgi:hypothetical protein
MPINIGDHSLAFLLGAQAVTDELQNLEPQFEELIEFTEESTDAKPIDSDGFQPFVITYVPVNKKLPFYFEVRGVKDTGRGSVVYAVAWKPAAFATVNVQSVNGGLDSVLTWFKQWTDLVKQYNTVRLSRRDRFTSESAEQFYADFELVDEDANTTPFDNDKQLVLYRLLDYIKQKVEQEEGADKEQVSIIVNEIKMLQANIPSMTKATAVKGLSRIFAKTKAFSIKLIADFFDVAKKEALKAALYGGLHEAEALFHSIHILP